ncbi:uncharacterized protein [Dysidea avara]|uniref:uncharacterized protein n=1 Tax=Dysidea avara TaxID=196820 RepID=UPI00331B05CD
MAPFVLLFTLLTLSAASIAQNDLEIRAETSPRTSLKEYLQIAQTDGIISKEQFVQLQDLAIRLGLLLDDGIGLPTEIPSEAPVTKPGIFMRLYNRLTLLNVLYFGGGLLVMGASTLFMTLAWEKLSGISLWAIIGSMSVCAGGVGIMFWNEEEYEMAGGLLCCISVSLVPFAVYSLERGLGWWPKGQDPGVFQEFREYIRPGWVVMEIATVVVGMMYIRFVRFPFLLAPVSFSLWFLSMDLAPLLPQYTSNLFQTRRWVSLLFGLVTIIAGFGAELTLGSHPDFGFWLYIFGIIPFWFSLMLEFPNRELLHSVQLVVNACLVLIGSELDRMTFQWFGVIGMCLSTSGILYIKSSKSQYLWMLKAVLASALVSQSLKSAAPLQVISALVGIVAFNINAAKFYNSGEVYFLIQLFTNLGYLIGLAKLFHPFIMEIWFVSLDLRHLFAFVCSIGVACFHLHIPLFSHNRYFFCYRFLMSIFLSLLLLLLQGGLFVVAGLVGIPTVIFQVLRRHIYRSDPPLSLLLLLIGATVFGIAFCSVLQSPLIYYTCCILCAMLLYSLYDKYRHQGVIVVLILVLLSIPFQSKSLLTICVLYMFFYLTWLAYRVFQNSLMFPIVLVVLGLGVIFLAVQYQQYEMFINDTFNQVTPVIIHLLLSDYTHWEFVDHYKISPQQSSTALNVVYDYVFWSSAAVSGFAKLSSPVLVGLTITIIVLLMLLYAITTILESFDKQSVGKVKINSFTIEISGEEYNHCGFVITVVGTKPKEMQKPSYLQLDIEGHAFWRKLEKAYGSLLITLTRSIFLPYKLTPNLVEFTSFEQGSGKFKFILYPLTGRSKSKRFSRRRIRNILKSLHGIQLQCILRFSTAWYKPYQQLCVVDINIDEVSFTFNA